MNQDFARTRGSRIDAVIYLTLALVTLALYWQVRGFAFVNYDDNQYVTQNARVQAGLTADNAAWAFTSGYACNWHPLTWLSHMLDCQLFGLNAGAHHLVNALFHTANVLLLYNLWRRMTGRVWPGAFVAALFGWHPMHVESVAFVAERKDVLSAFFGLLTLLAYWRYARAPDWRRYALMAAVFALALMSKPMMVSLPLLMLLLDYWPLQRTEPFRRLAWEKAPLLCLCAFSSVLTIWAQKAGGAMSSLTALPMPTRVENAICSYVKYLGKLLWPRDLVVLYRYPDHLPWGQVALSGALILGLTLGALALARRRPWLAVGWFWFLISLVPVIGLVQVGEQAMADRYTYLPSIGLFAAITFEAAAWVERWPWSRWLSGAMALAALAGCLMATYRQIGYWRDSVSLFSHWLDVTPDKALAYCCLGANYQAQGNIPKARAEFALALRFQPNYDDVYDDLGLMESADGHLDAAITNFQAALRANPNHDRALANLGVTLLRKGDVAGAIGPLTRAAELAPENPFAQYGLARALDAQDKLSDAIPHYLAAVRNNPAMVEAQTSLGAALLAQGKFAEADEHLAAAVKTNPAYLEAQLQSGNARLAEGKPAEAATFYREAARLQPSSIIAEYNLAAALDRAGNTKEAVTAAEQALKLATNAGDAEAAARLRRQLEAWQKK